MKETIADGAALGIMAFLTNLGLITLNDFLASISFILAIAVGVGRLALIVMAWRRK